MVNANLKTYFFCFFKWSLLLLLVGVFAGTLSALFLVSLNWATDFRLAHKWILFFLPFAGFLIGSIYHYLGQNVARGNNLVLDTIHSPTDIIPFKMAPLVLISTLLTHLFGGSAGREGTALQMSAATVDQLHKPFKLSDQERKILLITGLSAGFASVFGTPLAGALFGIEVLLLRKFPFKAVVPAVAAAYFAAYITEAWGVGHTHYHIGLVSEIGSNGLLYSVIAGLFFSVAAVLFVRTTHQIARLSQLIKYPPLRPLAGGIIIIGMVFLLDNQKYLGLGIPEIVKSFDSMSAPQDFILKILFTAITLGAGFKGGEVTPLFFIGATLGSTLSFLLPLPVGLLAGMGFVAVFGASAKTPIACCIMAMELFGISCGIYVLIGCVVSYLVSGTQSIYNAPENKAPHHFLFGKFSITPLFLYFRATIRK